MRRIKPQSLVVITTIFTLLLLMSCGSSDNGDSANENRFLSIGTAPPGGAFFVVGGAIASTVSSKTEALSWQVSAEATKGTQENIRRLESGELDFALANAAISYFAVRGEGAWQKPHNIRTVMTLAPNIALFITPKSSGVKSIEDLAGKRVVVGPAGAGFEYFIQPILKAHDITYDDFTPLNNTQAGAVDMLADGAAAAAFLGGAVPTASITQACASQDIHFIPFGAAERDSLFKNYPFFGPASIPAGTYRGQDADFAGMNVGNMHLITSASADEEMVYQFTKVLFQSSADVVKQHPAGRAINPKNSVRNTGTPFHPGAIRYFQEIGAWPKDAAGE